MTNEPTLGLERAILSVRPYPEKDKIPRKRP